MDAGPTNGRDTRLAAEPVPNGGPRSKLAQPRSASRSPWAGVSGPLLITDDELARHFGVSAVRLPPRRSRRQLVSCGASLATRRLACVRTVLCRRSADI